MSEDPSSIPAALSQHQMVQGVTLGVLGPTPEEPKRSEFYFCLWAIPWYARYFWLSAQK